MAIKTVINGHEVKHDGVSVNGGRTMYLVQNGQTIYHEAVNFARSVVANGSIGNGSTPNGLVPMGSSVTVIAVPNSGYAFTEWQRYDGTNWNTISGNATYTFTMDQSWREPQNQLRATFTLIQQVFRIVIVSTVLPSQAISMGVGLRVTGVTQNATLVTQNVAVPEAQVNGVRRMIGIETTFTRPTPNANSILTIGGVGIPWYGNWGEGGCAQDSRMHIRWDQGQGSWELYDTSAAQSANIYASANCMSINGSKWNLNNTITVGTNAPLETALHLWGQLDYCCGQF